LSLYRIQGEFGGHKVEVIAQSRQGCLEDFAAAMRALCARDGGDWAEAAIARFTWDNVEALCPTVWIDGEYFFA
jgi:hypothetical protein